MADFISACDFAFVYSTLSKALQLYGKFHTEFGRQFGEYVGGLRQGGGGI